MTARSKKWVAVGAAGAVAMLGTLASTTSIATARSSETGGNTRSHVLLISVDGLHQSDLTQFINIHPGSTLADLTRAGVNYSNASTSRPSDSFPGVLAPVTGGTPKSTGVFYDDSYARDLYAPPNNTTPPIPAGKTTCDVNPKGTEALLAENLDANALSGTRVILNPDGTTEHIDPNNLPWQKNADGSCTPVYPNDYLRTNTIFSVASAKGMLTAWSDKHPAYQLVNGHSTPNAVNDLFTPDINADIIPATLTDTRGKTITFPFPNPTASSSGPIITDYVGDTEAYDQIKVDAILNQIDGKTSTGKPVAGNKTPAIFGMNFQSVSVGQKTVDPTLTCDPARSVYGPNANAVKDKCNEEYVPGGYFENGAFTPQMEGATHYENGITTPGAMNFVDASLGAMVKELKAKHLYDSTEIIIEAKHGQSPINPDKLAKIGHKVGDVLAAANVNVAQLTDDDVALVWLADQSQTGAAVAALQADKAGPNTAHIEKVLHGAELAKLYNDPKTDPHTPDLIVLPTPGTIYTHSVAKVAEHGGFAPDDTHVALLVVNGSGHGTVDESVTTTQIAPTILKTLGLSPSALDAVKMEGTKPLPGSGD